VIKFTSEMVKNLHKENRWRGKDKADEDGCYVHHLPTHGPNIYGRTCFDRDPNKKPDMGGIVYPQWAIGSRSRSATRSASNTRTASW